MKHGDKSRQEILDAGLKLWRVDPSKVNARNIAKLIGKTHPTVYHHYPDKERLLKAVAHHGVQKGDSIVIVSMMLMGNPLIAELSEAERQKHLNVVKGLGTLSQEQTSTTSDPV